MVRFCDSKVRNRRGDLIKSKNNVRLKLIKSRRQLPESIWRWITTIDKSVGQGLSINSSEINDWIIFKFYFEAKLYVNWTYGCDGMRTPIRVPLECVMIHQNWIIARLEFIMLAIRIRKQFRSCQRCGLRWDGDANDSWMTWRRAWDGEWFRNALMQNDMHIGGINQYEF